MIHFVANVPTDNKKHNDILAQFKNIYGDVHSDKEIIKLFKSIKPCPFQPLMNRFHFDYDEWKSDPSNFTIPLDTLIDYVTKFSCLTLHPEGTELETVYNCFLEFMPPNAPNISFPTFTELYTTIRASIPKPSMDLKTIAKTNQELAMKIFMKSFPW